jgi:hypothetical protein
MTEHWRGKSKSLRQRQTRFFPHAAVQIPSLGGTRAPRSNAPSRRKRLFDEQCKSVTF